MYSIKLSALFYFTSPAFIVSFWPNLSEKRGEAADGQCGAGSVAIGNRSFMFVPGQAINILCIDTFLALSQ